MPDFWRHSGYHLTERRKDGRLAPGADLFRAYFARPEVAPIETSCAAERALFAQLQADPYTPLGGADLAGIADVDARENYRVVLGFRDRLLAAGTLELAYSDLFMDPQGNRRDFVQSGVPPLFVDQLAQMILRSILDGCADGLMARAAELFFREQCAHVSDGQVLLADLETVQAHANAVRDGSRYGSLGRLIAEANTPLAPLDMDILGSGNASMYWERDERHDTAIQINFGQAGLKALCSVIELWVTHFTGLEVHAAPVRQIEAARLHWYIGLDSAATRLMNDLYNGSGLDEPARQSVIALMSLRFPDETLLREEAKGQPCYLALAMDDLKCVRMKPQNILLNLPLQRPA